MNQHNAVRSIEADKFPEITKRIRRSYWVAAAIGIAVVSAYVIVWAGANAIRDTSDPAAWGQFGDYVGGLLNPVIAGLAFYWLTQSVKIQHAELSESRIALQESSNALERQVLAAERTSEINALNGLLAYFSADLSRLALEVGRLESERAKIFATPRENRIELVIRADIKQVNLQLDKIQDEISGVRLRAMETLDQLTTRLGSSKQASSTSSAALSTD